MPAIEGDDPGTARDSLEDFVHAHDPNGDVLAALAYCVFEEAMTVLVDEVVASSERVLLLLERARKAGLPPATAKSFRARVQRVLREERRREEQVLQLLERPVEQLDFTEVRKLADELDKRGGAVNCRRAAQLFQLAADKAPDDLDANYYLCRVGTSLAKCGDWEEALPWLERMASRDLVPDDPVLYDSFAMLAYNSLLEHAILTRDQEGFLKWWAKAKTCGTKRAYPAAHNTQDQILQAALDWDLPEVGKHVLQVMSRTRRPSTLSEEVQEMMGQAKQRFR